VPFVDPLEPANRANPHRCEPTVLEDYDNLAARPGQSNHVETVINAASKLVQVHFATSAAVEPLVVGRPNDLAADPVPVAGGGSALASGTPGAAIAPGDLIGDPALPPDRRTGLAGLGDSEDVALLVAPDEVHASIADRGRVTDALIEQCELRRDRFAILSIAGGQARAEDVHPPRDSSYGAVYHPWIRVRDARSQDTWLIPSVGHVAGIYARVDVERGVHKAPANEVVRGIVTQDLGPDRNPLEYRIREHEQAILSARGVNAIRDFRPERGIRVWGARTMSTDPEWRYVSVRRLLSYIEESIARGTRWVVFEPNGEPLWAQVRLSITSFLTSTWTSGALQGHKADEAFFVRCGRDTMTQDDIDGGRLVCQVGLAPIKPAEFVILRIQWALVSEP
jgi:phage tail sheath protein FI